MSVTASPATEVVTPSGTRLFLRTRPSWLVLGGSLLLGALTAWLGAYETPVPMAATDGSSTIPLWRLLAMGAAVLPILTLHSRLADLEVVSTSRFRGAQRRYLAVATAGGATIFLSLALITLPPAVLAVMGRSWLAWTGLALAAGAVLGWRLAWTLPTFVVAALIYWGFGDGHYRWWEFSARPYDDLPSLLLSLTLLVAGLIAYSATPWRRRRLRLGRWSGHRPAAG